MISPSNQMTDKVRRIFYIGSLCVFFYFVISSTSDALRAAGSISFREYNFSSLGQFLLASLPQFLGGALGITLLVEMSYCFFRDGTIRSSSLFSLLKFHRSHEADLFIWLISTLPLTIGIFAWFASSSADYTQMALSMFGWNAGALTELSIPYKPLFLFLLTYLANSFLDFGLHFLWHRVPFFWELHKIHHSAETMTVFTVFREHPILSLLSTCVKAAVFVALGFDAVHIGAVLLISNFHVTLLHSKIRSRWGKVGTIFISPHAHHLHHSIDPERQRCNLGLDITLWDRIFGTYRAADEEPIRIGLDDSAEKEAHVLLELVMNFISAMKRLGKVAG